MQAVFYLHGEPTIDPSQQNGYRLNVCFNGEPGTVVLEVDAGDGSELKVRALLKASEARAVASAILSAATEAKV